MSQMTDADWEVLSAYLRTTADSLGLRDWFLLLKHEPPTDDDVLAEVSAVYGRKFAVVRVCLEFRELTREEQRQVICHELLHCHHAQLGHVVSRILTTELGHAGDMLMIPIRNEFELLVDAISQEWHGALPYIEWTTQDPGSEDSIHAPWEGPTDHGRTADRHDVGS